MVIDAAGIKICAVRGNRESLCVCLRNALNEPAKFTPWVFTFENIEVKMTAMEQTEGLSQV